MKINLENLGLREKMALGGLLNGTAAFAASIMPPADTRGGTIGLGATALGMGAVYLAEKTGVSQRLSEMVKGRKRK